MGTVPEPADQGHLGGRAVVGILQLGHLPVPRQGRSRILRQRRLRGLGDHHGHHAIDLIQPVVTLLHLQLQLFHRQPLALQGKIGQGGIEGHEHIALFHRIAGCHQYLGNGLGAGQVDRLNLIGGNRAVALLAVAPVLGHAHHVKIVHIHRLRIPAAEIAEAEEAAAPQHSQHQHGDENCLPRGFFTHPPHLPIWAGFEADRPEYDRSYPRRRQWQARG